MCVTSCSGCCHRPVKGGSTGVVAAARLLGTGVWLAGRYVVFPAAVLGFRWLSGAPMVPNARPVSAPAWLVRVRWSQWPRWQRATVRFVFTALVVSGVLAPVATAVTVAAVVSAGAGVVCVRRRPTGLARGARRRVTVKVGPGVPDRGTR